MYSDAKQIEKNFAFVIVDHLNCVTFDAWPAQETVGRLLHCSTKTIQRAADGLERRQLITVKRSPGRMVRPRYTPIFIADDWDIDGQDLRQDWPEKVDTVVQQSSSSIQPKSSPSGGRAEEMLPQPRSNYKRAQRGMWEIELARRLGPYGEDVLSRLASIDDSVVENLCRALCDGELGPRELAAARLAAEQLPARWRKS